MKRVVPIGIAFITVLTVIIAINMQKTTKWKEMNFTEKRLIISLLVLGVLFFAGACLSFFD